MQLCSKFVVIVLVIPGASSALGASVWIKSAAYTAFSGSGSGSQSAWQPNVTNGYSNAVIHNTSSIATSASIFVNEVSSSRLAASGTLDSLKDHEDPDQYQTSSNIEIRFRVKHPGTTIQFGGNVLTTVNGGPSDVLSSLVVYDSSNTPVFLPDSGGGTPTAIAQGWYMLSFYSHHISQSALAQGQYTSWDMNVRFDSETIPLPSAGVLGAVGFGLIASRRRRN